MYVCRLPSAASAAVSLNRMLVADESVLVGLFSIFTGKECGRMCNVTVK